MLRTGVLQLLFRNKRRSTPRGNTITLQLNKLVNQLGAAHQQRTAAYVIAT
jgi:hypothetical protein